MTNIKLELSLPDELAVAFMQLIRDFEQRDPANIRVQMWAESPDLSLTEVENMLRKVSPPFPHFITSKKEN